MPRYGKERHLLVEAPLLEGLGQGAGVNELLREIHVKVADARQVHALAVPQVAAAEVAVQHDRAVAVGALANELLGSHVLQADTVVNRRRRMLADGVFSFFAWPSGQCKCAVHTLA